jgi:pyridoxine 5-phosphate synthase
VELPLNLEMAPTDEMLSIAIRHQPHAACIVPEKREERTTEGGIDAARQHNRLAPFVGALSQRGIRVSLFVEADRRQLDAAKSLGAPVVELHTGAYCDAETAQRKHHLEAIRQCAAYGVSLGLEVHAGHGLGFETVGAVASVPEIRELNIGHFLVGEAIFSGLDAAIRRMRALMDEARARADVRNIA